MDLVKQFREYTRQLECHLDNMNQSDCCCCGVSTAQCFIIVEIGRKPGISVKELAEILRVYITAKRIVLAQQLIKNGEPATSVAQRTGFQNYSSFYRAYMKQTGHSPTSVSKKRN